MSDDVLKPNRGSLLKAVEQGLGLFADKSADTLKLRAVTKEDFHRRGFGNSYMVTFKSGATQHCYAAEIVLCQEDDDGAVEVYNYVPGSAKIEEWAEELWKEFLAEDDGEVA